MLFHPLHPEVPHTIPDSFSTALRCDAGDDDDDASLSCHLTDLDRDDNRVTLAQAGGCGLVPIPLPIVFCHDAWQRPPPKSLHPMVAAMADPTWTETREINGINSASCTKPLRRGVGNPTKIGCSHGGSVGNTPWGLMPTAWKAP